MGILPIFFKNIHQGPVRPWCNYVSFSDRCFFYLPISQSYIS